MAIITRNSGYAYLNRCTTCHKEWVSENDDGGEERKKHKH